MKLYVEEYVTVPFVTMVGTSMESKRVEFWPGTVGSGEKLTDVNWKREAPLEQSDTEAFTFEKNEKAAKKNAGRLNMFWCI